MTPSVLVPLFLLGALTVRGADEPGIIKGADGFRQSAVKMAIASKARS